MKSSLKKTSHVFFKVCVAGVAFLIAIVLMSYGFISNTGAETVVRADSELDVSTTSDFGNAGAISSSEKNTSIDPGLYRQEKLAPVTTKFLYGVAIFFAMVGILLVRGTIGAIVSSFGNTADIRSRQRVTLVSGGRQGNS